jgi:plastocyanin
MRQLLSLTAALAAFACGGGGSDNQITNPPPPPPPPVATTSVTLQNLAFNPKAIKVSPSATVSFTNSDGIAHNVTFSSTAVTSVGNFSTGTKTVVMPATPGTYAYHCTIHAGMTGSVLVQ